MHRRIAAAVACCALAIMVTGSLVLAPASRADVIEGAITSISTTATQVDQWDQVDFTCTWAVPDGSQPGDTFTLQLPPELRWFGSRTFALRAPDGSDVATATVDDSGYVVFTLTGYVATHPVDVHGTCSFSTQYAAVGTGEEVELVFVADAGVVRVPLETGEPCTVNCAGSRDDAGKDMWWVDGDQQATTSVIWAPATPADTNTVTLTDVPGPGLALDCASVEAHIGRHLDATGRLTVPFDDGAHPAAIYCTSTHLAVTWTDVPEGEYTQIRVDAHVTDPSRSEYTNSATARINGVDTPVVATVRRTDGSGTGVGTAPTTSTTTTASPTTSTTTATTATTTTTPPTPPTSTPSTTAIAPTISSTTTSAAAITSTGSTSVTQALGRGTLAFTGAEVWRLTLAGAVLVAFGALLSWSRRRQHR